MLVSPLKWAGGKSALIPQMQKIWILSKSDRWVDLFCGGCSLPLAIAPNEVLINDINPHLIDFWTWVQGGAITGIEYKNDREYYFEMRERFNVSPSPDIFYYLNKTGFNGLVRYNRKGQFNVPFGTHKNIKYLRNFKQYQEAISGWQITNLSFEKVELIPGDFAFADPPYDDGWVGYSSSGFSWENQIELAEKLAKHQGMAIATNKATDRIIELYSDLGFEIKIIEMPRRISCNGDRKSVKEMFAFRGGAIA